MTDAVIASIITGSITLIGTLAGTISSNHLTHSKTLYRIGQLESKVEKHNNLVERMYIAEGSIRVLEEKQKDFDDDLSEIKGKL